MNAWVAVFDHPLFSVTDGGGRFTIAGVPPGTYTLVAWHERFGKVEEQVTVPPDAGRKHRCGRKSRSGSERRFGRFATSACSAWS